MTKELLLSANSANTALPIQLEKLLKREDVRQIEIAVGTRDMLMTSAYGISRLQAAGKIDERLQILKTPENLKLDVSWMKWVNYYMLLKKRATPLTNRDLRLLYESDRLFSSPDWQEVVLAVPQKTRSRLSVRGFKNLRGTSPQDLSALPEKEWDKLIQAGYDKNDDLNQYIKIKSYIKDTSDEHKKKLSAADLSLILFRTEIKDMVPSGPLFYAFYTKLSQEMKLALSSDHIRFINDHATDLDPKRLNTFIKKYGINGIYLMGLTDDVCAKLEEALKKDLKDRKMDIHIASYKRIHFDLIQSIGQSISAQVLHQALADPQMTEKLIHKYIEKTFLSGEIIQPRVLVYYLQTTSTQSLNALIQKTGGNVPETIARAFLDRNTEGDLKSFNNKIMQQIFRSIMRQIDPDDSRYISRLVDNMHLPIKFRNVQRNIAADFILKLKMDDESNIEMTRLFNAYQNFSDNIEWPSKKKRVLLTRLARQYARFLRMPAPKIILYDPSSKIALKKKERGYYHPTKEVIFINIEHPSFYNFLASFDNIIFMLHKRYLALIVKNNADKELSLTSGNDYILAAKILRDKKDVRGENTPLSLQQKRLIDTNSSQDILALYVAGKATESLRLSLGQSAKTKDTDTKKKKNSLFGRY
ncbi:MAG: hypothetical protein ACTSXQ_07980 [Alphaproteobacteria bacterium]